MENGKIVGILNELATNVYTFTFNAINSASELTAQFISQFTDILSVNELEKLVFVCIIVFLAKCAMTGFSDALYTSKLFIRSLWRTKPNQKLNNINGRSGALQPGLNAKHFLPKLIAKKQVTSVAKLKK